MRTVFLAIFLPAVAWSMLIGNPAQPALQRMGVICSSPSWWSFRAGYVDDYVYRARFKDEFTFAGIEETASYIKLTTNAALVTVNFKNVFDFYGIIGGARLQLDREVYNQQQPAWGIGGKFIFLRSGAFRMGADFKYFKTKQQPQFIVSDGLPYNITSDFELCYSEIQASVGMSYRIPLLCPYVQVTYLISRLEPHPYIASVRVPLAGMADTPADIISKSVIGQRRWGLAVGATIISGSKSSLTLETRMFNQNAVDVNGEIRF